MRNPMFILVLGAAFLLGAAPTQPASVASKQDEARVMKQGLMVLEDQYERARGEKERALDTVATLRAKIAEDSGRIDASPESIRAEIVKLEEQQEQLQLEEAGAAGRRKGLEEAVKKYTDIAQAQGANDPVVTELTKVVQLREQELERLQAAYKAGTVSAGDFSAAEMALAQSRAELAAAKQKAAGRGGANDALDAWNRESMNLSIDELDRQARLKYLATRLSQLKQVVTKLADLVEAQNEVLHAGGAVMAAKQRLDQARVEEALQSR